MKTLTFVAEIFSRARGAEHFPRKTRKIQCFRWKINYIKNKVFAPTPHPPTHTHHAHPPPSLRREFPRSPHLRCSAQCMKHILSTLTVVLVFEGLATGSGFHGDITTKARVVTSLRAHRMPRPLEAIKSLSAIALASFGLGINLPTPTLAQEAAIAQTSGFEEFAAKGGVMKTDPSCFFDQCGPQSKACFTNPSCLKGITCLGNCRGEQLCATQCFARFGSDKLNSWLSCTLEEKKCVTTGVEQDTSSFYLNPPRALSTFKSADLEGKWFKVLGYNPNYDMYPCQVNFYVSTLQV